MAIIKEDNGDASADSGTQYTISLDDVFQGTLDTAGNKDWIRIELTAGTIYDITLSSDTGSVQFELLDSQGIDVFHGRNVSTGTKLTFNPTVTSAYYISVHSRNNYSGDYEISVAENTTSIGTYDEIADYMSSAWGGRTPSTYGYEPGGVLAADITAPDRRGPTTGPLGA